LEYQPVPDIRDIIPHRPPFLLVDALTELQPGKRARGTKCVAPDEWFLQGHFPGLPIMPGVLIIEAMAQVGAAALLAEDEYRGLRAYFAGINRARFRRKVVPGDLLVIETELVRKWGRMGIGAAVAMVGDKVVAEAEIMFAVEQPPNKDGKE
jgi:3-hydroxyacyl-[acyl-carrier-protein] dehydratase